MPATISVTISVMRLGVLSGKHGKLMDINEIFYYIISKNLSAVKRVADDIFFQGDVFCVFVSKATHNFLQEKTKFQCSQFATYTTCTAETLIR